LIVRKLNTYAHKRGMCNGNFNLTIPYHSRGHKEATQRSLTQLRTKIPKAIKLCTQKIKPCVCWQKGKMQHL
jgi:hypothetical protein